MIKGMGISSHLCASESHQKLSLESIDMSREPVEARFQKHL